MYCKSTEKNCMQHYTKCVSSFQIPIQINTLKVVQFYRRSITKYRKKFFDVFKRSCPTIIPYLKKLLGENKTIELKRALANGEIIVVSGVEESGKTTLVRTLNTLGYVAVEDFNVYKLNLTKSLETCDPNIDDVIFSDPNN